MNYLGNRVSWLFLAGALSVVASAERMPRNSYLAHHVSSVSELVGQVKSNPVVADHFMRHFSMSRDEVIGYFLTLHMDKLGSGRSMLVYGVPTDGKIHGTMQNLPAGDKMFFDNLGNPVLRVVCGNPVTLGPKRPMAMNDSHGKPVGSVIITPFADVPQGSDLPNTNATASMEPVAPEIITKIETSPVAPQIIPPVVAAGGFNPLPLLLPLAVAGTTVRNHGNPTPVPEPMTMIALGAGVAAVAKKRKK